jgi:hypothetical protein
MQVGFNVLVRGARTSGDGAEAMSRCDVSLLGAFRGDWQ